MDQFCVDTDPPLPHPTPTRRSGSSDSRAHSHIKVGGAEGLRRRGGLRQTSGSFPALLLEPVHVEGFVLEGSGEQRGVSGAVCLDGLTETGVLGGGEVRVVLSGPVHDLQGGKAGEVSGSGRMKLSS